LCPVAFHIIALLPVLRSDFGTIRYSVLDIRDLRVSRGSSEDTDSDIVGGRRRLVRQFCKNNTMTKRKTEAAH
jgi:hypothetical protein